MDVDGLLNQITSLRDQVALSKDIQIDHRKSAFQYLTLAMNDIEMGKIRNG